MIVVRAISFGGFDWRMSLWKGNIEPSQEELAFEPVSSSSRLGYCISSQHSAMSLNVTDPALLEAYDDVRDDKTATDWAFFDFAAGKPDRLQVAGTGSGGLSEFMGQLKDDVAGWGYVRMNMSNDE